MKIPRKQFVTFSFHHPSVVWALGTSRNFQIGISFMGSVVSGTQQSRSDLQEVSLAVSPEDLENLVWDQGSSLRTLRGKQVFS